MYKLVDLLFSQNPWWVDPAARLQRARPSRRAQQQRLKQALGEHDRRAQVLVGPRQVGKSVALGQTIDELLDLGVRPANITFFDFSDERAVGVGGPREIVAHQPRGLVDSQTRFFFFDEIAHWGDAWASWLKQAVDKTAHRYVVTDSVAALLRTGGRESGLGRWDELRFEPMVFSEFLSLLAVGRETALDVLRKRPQAVDDYLGIGGFPEHIQSVATIPQERLRSRLREDIADRAIYRDLVRSGLDLERVHALFISLLEDSGAIVDPARRANWLTEIGQGKAPDARSLQNWIAALTNSMLVIRLEPWGASPGGRVRARAYARFFAADPGIISAFSPQRDPPRDAQTRGKLVEAAVFRHLRELGSCAYARGPSGEAEIDFLLVDQGRPRIGVEVKAGRASRQECERLIANGKRWKVPRLVMVHEGAATAGADLVELALEDVLLDPRRVLEGTP